VLSTSSPASRLGALALALLGLGIGCRPTPSPTVPRPAPVPERRDQDVPAGPVYTQVAAHADHTCVLRRTGDVLCWGKNTYGQLGNGHRNDMARAAPVAGLVDATSIAVGLDFSCAVRRHGSVVCWGNNEDGQLGDGRGGRPGVLSLRPAPVAGVENVQQLVTGRYHACALEGSGRVKCWGNGADGQMGSDAQRAFATPQSIARLGAVRQIASGASHVCALEQDGGVQCWGRNTEGQLGDGERGSKIRPVRVRGLTGAVAIAAGHNHVCATLAGATLACWGDNAKQQIGPQAGRESRQRTPVAVPGLRDVVQVDGGAAHTCARLQSGRVTCWGANDGGQLGHHAAAASRATATPVRGISDAVDLSLGARHSCAIRHRGDLLCWGSSDHDALGEHRLARLHHHLEPAG
jgi:alpha-tubulin suppressor-like RCC1 family protein